MKKIIILLFAAILLVGCEKENEFCNCKKVKYGNSFRVPINIGFGMQIPPKPDSLKLKKIRSDFYGIDCSEEGLIETKKNKKIMDPLVIFSYYKTVIECD